jgi:hypothetical protein
MLTLYDYYPTALVDSTKYVIPLVDLQITTEPTIKKVYFALLYKAFSYFVKEFYAVNNLPILTGQIPLLSYKQVRDEFTVNIIDPFVTWDNDFGIRLQFNLVTQQPITLIQLNDAFDITQLLSWNASNVLIYNYPNYFSDWYAISGVEILIYLLNIGLHFKDANDFQIFYLLDNVTSYVGKEFVQKKYYRFFITFRFSIPNYFTNFTAMEII